MTQESIGWSSIEYGNEPTEEDKAEISKVQAAVNRLLNSLDKQGIIFTTFDARDFTRPALFNALDETVGEGRLADYLVNSIRFDKIIQSERMRRSKGDESGLLGEYIQVKEGTHENGSQRREEEGCLIQIKALEDLGVDPQKVLFYRITQPSLTPKAEYYWTSDFSEVSQGLTAEISPEKKRSSVILVADLKSIDSNGGLIQDMNDDGGMSVRQIGAEAFGQQEALVVIQNYHA